MSIFYYCPSSRSLHGGVKQTYRHVEALRDAGFDAYILSPTSEPTDWFYSHVPVAVLQRSALHAIQSRLARTNNPISWLHERVPPSVRFRAPGPARPGRRLTADDIIVLPEIYGKLLAPCAFGSKVVIFNQNAHYTFRDAHYADELKEFLHRRGAVAALAVSNHIVDYLRFAFPDLNVLLATNGVDIRKFHPAPKKRQIAFMPRKLPRDLVQVIQILRGRGSLRGWDLCPIDGASEDAVANLLGESAFFLSSCDAEGFGLPPLEAAASGCVVVGYCGQAATEFMLPEYCYPVGQGDVLGFARTLERLLKEYDADPSNLTQQANRFADFVARNYSKENEAAGVINAWTSILAMNAGASRR